jgi:1,3-beta-glucanosyltransferase GAS1
MDAFSSYSNVLGFFVGDELIHSLSQSDVASYIKAAILDLKSYRNEKGYRKIPIGHASADVAGLMPFFQDYLACGSESIDFFGLNSFAWCDPSSFTTSGYNYFEGNSTGYDIPIFFSETGCTTGTARTFADQAAIFGSDMDGQWSGAIIYEWTNESTGFGLVTYGVNAVTTGTPTTINSDYANLQKQWLTLTPTGTPSSLYKITATIPACPAFTSSGWQLSGDVPLPTLIKVVDISNSTTSTSTTTPTLPTISNGSPTSTGLSTGAKIGIAIGIILLLIIASVAAFLLSRRKKNSTPAPPPLDLNPEGLEVGGPPAKEIDGTSFNVHEIGSDPSKNRPRPTSPAELGNHQHVAIPPPSELPTSPATGTENLSPPPITPSSGNVAGLLPPTTASSWASAPWQNEVAPLPNSEHETEA